MSGDPVVAALDVRRPLSLLASALAERPLDALEGLPRADERRALRVAVLRQVVRTVEADRAALPIHGALLRRVFGFIDQARIDAVVAERYPGARADLQRLRERALDGRPAPRWHRPLAASVESLRQWALGASAAALAATDPRRRLEALFDAARPGVQPGATAHDSLRAAIAVCAWLGATTRRGGHAVAVQPLPAAPIVGAPDGAGQEAGALVPGAADGARAGRANDFDFPVATPNARVDEFDQVAAARAARGDGVLRRYHDEWDCTTQRYRRAWTCVHERRLHGTDLGYLGTLRAAHAALAHDIRRGFATLRPLRRERVRGTTDGDAIDLERAIQARVDRRAGQLGDGRVYTTTHVARRDVCALFLVDMSASTGYPLPDETPAADTPADDEPYFYARPSQRAAPPAKRRRVIDIARDAIALMCEALERLGDRHAVFGYSGEGRLQVDLHIAKGFDDAWTARSAAALAAIEPQGSTRTGAALRHALAHLARETARTRLLILLTDGYPQDRDYGPDPRDTEYGLQDTAQALREAERVGVAAFCISVDRAAHDYLRRVCPASRYLVIDEIAALPEQLAATYRRLTLR